MEEHEIISNGLNFRSLYSQIHRKNNQKNNMFYGIFDEELEEHIGLALPHEEVNEEPTKKAGK
jgi:hypothetical protein